MEIKYINAFVNKPVCLGLSILEISKTVMYETETEICYMDR